MALSTTSKTIWGSPDQSWVAPHHLGYRCSRRETVLAARMVCNAIFSVREACRSQHALGRITADAAVPALRLWFPDAR
jgi:hypothetical protein